jgi:hypothetical protein
MMLAGIPVRDADVLELARLLRDAGFDEVAERLETAYDREAKVLALTIADREAILRALDDPPDGLAELRGVLLREHEWRVRTGLACGLPAAASCVSEVWRRSCQGRNGLVTFARLRAGRMYSRASLEGSSGLPSAGWQNTSESSAR